MMQMSCRLVVRRTSQSSHSLSVRPRRRADNIFFQAAAVCSAPLATVNEGSPAACAVVAAERLLPKFGRLKFPQSDR